MPPKKSSKQTKCPFNNRGYCQKKEACENKHSDEVCNDFECEEVQCDKRHPNPCKFGPRCKFNKKSQCMYLHVTLAPDDNQIKALNKRLKELENKKGESIDTVKMKQVEEKFKVLENHISSLRKESEIKDKKINALDLRVEELEKESKAVSVDFGTP